MERTLILCKPDCVEKNLVGEVLSRFEKAGLRLVGLKTFRLSAPVLAEHYAHIKDRPFYPEIEKFMMSRPVVGAILQGANAVNVVRELLGPTDSRKAAKGTIRGDLGTDNMVNIAHASDSVANAELEVKRFFLPTEIFV
jgi:nucleoside-diphosphate kinase